MTSEDERADSESADGVRPGITDKPAPEGKAASQAAPVDLTPPIVLTPRQMRLAIWGGARASVLAKAPEEADRFTKMLPLLLATAILSGVSMSFAVATGVLPGEPLAWFVAIPVAVMWASLIFIVDRALTSSMKSTRSRGRLAAAAAPRVLLAALIGIVVSGPLVLQIFANDIRQEMVNINLEQGTTQTKQLGAGPAKDRLDRASKELNALRQQAQTGLIDGVTSSSQATIDARARVATLQTQLDAQRATLAEATALFVCERNGAPLVEGCTGKAGEGQGYDRAVAAMQHEQETFDQLSKQLEDAQNALAAAEKADASSTESTAKTNRAEAEAALPAAQAEYDDALSAYAKLTKTVNDANASAVGLIAQIRALEHLQARDPYAAMLHGAIALLFFAIELMPVTVKMFRSYGDPNPYELAEDGESSFAAARLEHRQRLETDELDHVRRLRVDRYEHEREEERRERDARSESTRAVEDDMLQREVVIGIEQNARVAAQMESVVSQALDQWEREVQQVFDERLGEATSGNAYPSSAGARDAWL